jgi:hypothetical protein
MNKYKTLNRFVFYIEGERLYTKINSLVVHQNQTQNTAKPILL